MALGDSSPADETPEIIETLISLAGSDTGRLVAAITEEGESAYLVSGFGVGQSVGPRVCVCIHEWSP